MRIEDSVPAERGGSGDSRKLQGRSSIENKEYSLFSITEYRRRKNKHSFFYFGGLENILYSPKAGHLLRIKNILYSQ